MEYRDRIRRPRHASWHLAAAGCLAASLLVAPTAGRATDQAVASPSRVLPTIAVGPTDTAMIPLVPARLTDTRPGASTVDGLYLGAGTRTAGSEYRVPIAGRGGAPTDATAAVLNVTAVDPRAGGYLTVHPCLAVPPIASSLNYATGVNVANEIVASLATDGAVCVYTSAAADLIIDIVGFVPIGNALTPLPPARLLETREGAPTVDGIAEGIGRTSAGSTTTVDVAGRAGVPTVVDAVVVNVAALDPADAGFVTVHPCLPATPMASSLNHVPGVNRANELITPIDSSGAICIYTQHDLDLVVDVVGYVPLGTTYHDTAPARLLDTRPGAATVDGANAGEGSRAAGSEYRLPIAGRGGVAADAVAAIVNVTAVDPHATGHLTVHPCSSPRPETSALNYTGGVNAANEIVAQLDPGGELCVFTHAATDLLIDVVGYLEPPVLPATITIVASTDPAGGTGFEFTDDIAAPGAFTLGDNGNMTFTDLEAGTYAATETVPDGWDLTAITCDDADSAGDLGTATATIHVDAGETVTCTFANTARGTIVVTKRVFCPSGCWLPYTFDFYGDASGTIGNGESIVVDNLVPGTYTSSERSDAGPWEWPWDTSICCDDDNSTADVWAPTATFHLDAGETVTCTFTNTRWYSRW